MLEIALDEEALGGATGIGAEAKANAGVGELLDVDLVLLEGADESSAFGIADERLELLGKLGDLLWAQTASEERIIGRAAAERLIKAAG